jgi:hypothetical protein
MGAAARGLAQPEAAAKLADALLELAQQRADNRELASVT